MQPEPSGVPERAPHSAARLVEACRHAVEAVEAAPSEEPAAAVEAALQALHDSLDGACVSVFVLHHRRLWILGSRGYSVILDGISVEEGIVGRAARTGRPQFVADVAEDSEYVAPASGIVAALALPLREAGEVVGVLDIESVRPLPPDSARLTRRLVTTLAPLVAELRSSRALDLPGAARLFVHMSLLREPRAIAELAAGSLARVLPVETAQVFIRSEESALEQAASWRSSDGGPNPIDPQAAERLLRRDDGSAVSRFVHSGGRRPAELADTGAASAVVIPLRANGQELGMLVGTSRRGEEFDRERAELASLLGAHTAASLDAALSIGRAQRTALTDPLTGLLNRRGFEDALNCELSRAQAARCAVSLVVVDCDDFKDVNDRAGHEFGDALLRELGDVLCQSLPEGASGARLGGDEFVVMLPDVEAEPAEEIANDVRARIVKGLDAAGFPVRLSAGVSTYPYDGGSASQLVRAADQALYEAKGTGKNRVVAFRELVRRGAAVAPRSAERRQPGRLDTRTLIEAAEAASALWEERTAQGVLERLCKSVAFVVGATGCAASRVNVDRLVDVAQHSLRDVDLGEEASYLIADFPLTQDVLETKTSRAISFLDQDLDRAEAFVLRDIQMNCCLLVPLVVHGRAWGLVELYDMRLRRYSHEDQAVAEFLVAQAARCIESFTDGEMERRRLPLFRLPSAEA